MSLYITAIAWVYFKQNNLVFQENTSKNTEESSLNPIKYQVLELSQKPLLSSWIIPSPVEKDIWVLFLHGTDSNIASPPHQKRYKIWSNLGISILSVDYPGYGNSKGTPSEQNLYEASKAAYMYLRKQEYIPEKRIIIYGEGIGASLALKLANEVQVGGVIIENGLTSLPDLAQEIYPILPLKWILKNKFNAINLITQLQAPLLLFHSDKNEQIPLVHGEKLFQNAPQPKTFIILKGKHHTAIADDALAYQKAISSFLKDLKLRQL
jgi:uncharacterized protein